MEKQTLPKTFLEHMPWDENSNPLWPASSFFLCRNLAKYLFPHKLNEAQSMQLLDLMAGHLLKLKELQNPVCIRAEKLTPIDKEFLYEHFLSKEGFQNTLKGQAFVLDESAHFMATLNVQDHLQMELIDCRGSWEKTWEKLSRIESSLAEALEYAFCPRFGYLTSDPTNCGTALSVMCYLHLPLLIHSKQLQEVLDAHTEESVAASGLQSSADDMIGDFVVLQNLFTLGLTEENILRDLHMVATKLTLAEKTLRSKVKENNDPEIKDQISRAFGLLMHSYQIQTKEALNALSKIKLGIDLGWVGGITDSKINEIFFKCRRAHVVTASNDPALDKENLLRKRAEYLHKELKAAEVFS